MKKFLALILIVGVSVFFYLKKEGPIPPKELEAEKMEQKVEGAVPPLNGKNTVIESKTEQKTEEKVEGSDLVLDFSKGIESEKFKQKLMSLNPKDEILVNIPEYGEVKLKVNHSFDYHSKRIVKGFLGDNKNGVFWFTPNVGEDNSFGFVELTSEDKFIKLIVKDGSIQTKIDTVSNTRCKAIEFASDKELKEKYLALYDEVYDGPLVKWENLTLGYLTNGSGNDPKIQSNPIDVHRDKELYSYHSYRGAQKVLLLDVNGHVEPLDSPWGAYSKTQGIEASPYDLDNNERTFTEEEQKNIYRIWAFISEKFYAFKVNVTTDEDLYNRTAPTRRSRMVVAKDMNGVLGNSGGVAYLNSFGNSRLDTGWAVLDFATRNPSSFAKVLAHEAGHQMGLGHDGNIGGSIHSNANYYHGISSLSWAPIMGGDKQKATHQWNNGTYPEANNKQDDVKVIAGHLGYRPSDYFDYPTEENGKKVYPEIQLDKVYPSFIAPRPKAPDGEVISSSVIIDHDYFKFSLNNQDVEVKVNKIQTAPTLFLTAKLYKLDSKNRLTPLDQYVLRGNKFSPSLQESGQNDYLLKVSTGTKSLTQIGHYGSIGQYLVEVKNLLNVESPRDVRDDEVISTQNLDKLPKMSYIGRGISVSEGRSTSLTAVYNSAYPIKKVQWRIYNEGEEKNTDNYLKIVSRKQTSWLKIEKWMHNKILKTMLENEYGRGFSGTKSITIKNYSPHRGRPIIVHEPVKMRLNPGRNHNFKVVSVGENLQYLWYKNGKLIENSNHPILALKKLVAEDRGTYFVKVKNNQGEVRSKDVTLNITGYTLTGPSVPKNPTDDDQVKLALTQNPKGGEVKEGASFTFSSRANTPVNFQWYKNNQPLPNQKNKNLSLSNISNNDSGWYFVEISKGSSKLKSSQVYLKVKTVIVVPAPTILRHPVSTKIKPGGNIRLEVLASGNNLSYQWIKNGGIIPGAHSNLYNIQSATKGDQGDYAVSVSNSKGSVVSQKATITIEGSSLSIIKNLVPLQADEGGVAQFELTVQGGSGHYSYYWYKDGKFLKNTSYPFYRMTGVNKKDEGLYHGVVKDGQNEVMSSKVQLSIKGDLKPLRIVQNLTSLKIDYGGNARFNIEAQGGSGNYTYYWYKNGQPLKDTSYPFYNISIVDKNDEGLYHGVIKDGISEIQSLKVNLTVKEKTEPKEKEEDGPRFLSYCNCNKPLDNYYDFCLRENQWRCQNIDSSIKMNENVKGLCANIVKNDLKQALKILLKKDESIYSLFDQCADYLHPYFEKKEKNSTCERLEKEVVSFLNQGDHFKEFKSLLKNPESIGFCLRSFPKN